jgi:DNA-binding GntR family transcriptional regulator
MVEKSQKALKPESSLPTQNFRKVAPTLPDKPEHGMSVMTAFQQIRELIVHGRLSPGTWVVEGDLAERLNISRTPVRAALHWLQRDGYVHEHRTANKCRIVVAPLTKEDAGELYSIIGHTEGLAGRMVASLPEKLRMDLSKKLTALNEQLGAIRENSTGTGSIFDLDREFHCLIVEAGAGPRLLTLHKAVEPQAERYWRLYASSILHDLRLSVAEHEAIIAALRRGDANELEKALQLNWQKGWERLSKVIDVFGERGSW